MLPDTSPRTSLPTPNRVRGKLSSHKGLIAILQELGYITREQLLETLRKNIFLFKIGDLLVELGYIKPADLQAALGIQKESQGAKKLGEVLVENRFIDELTFAQALSFQLGIPYAELDLEALDGKLVAKVSLRLMIEHLFIPIREEGGKVELAIANPLDKAACMAARKIFGNNILFVIATAKGIREAIDFIQRSASRQELSSIDENTIIGLVNGLSEDALKEGASDIHIEPMRDRLRVRLRRDGILMLHKDLAKELGPPLSSRIKILAEVDITEKRRHQGGRILYESAKSGQSLDLRVSFYVTIYGEKIVLRLLNKKGELIDIKDIGMPPRMLERVPGRCGGYRQRRADDHRPHRLR